MKKPIILLAGPTAVGKTDLSIQLAKKIGAEIISADSMQVYKHMDIGSAKISKAEMDGIPHHLIDALEPWEEFNVVRFQSMAKEAMNGIYQRGKIPIIVGGTGFYIQALLYDIDFTQTENAIELRLWLESLAQDKSPEYLHLILQQIDPASAGLIHANNVKRVIRAIEFYWQTGERISQHNEKERQKVSPYEFIYYVLNMERNRLYERINKRVDQMLLSGLVDEVKNLLSMGCTKDMVSMQGLGYKEIIDYLDGLHTLEEVSERLKRDTRHFAKRQVTWFKREPEISWLNLGEFDSGRSQVLEQMLCEIESRWRNYEFKTNL